VQAPFWMRRKSRQIHHMVWKKAVVYRLATPERIMYGKSVKAGSYLYNTYRLDLELGSGSSGSVFLAWHNRLLKHVVIKAVENCSSSTLEVRRNEVEALKKIKNIHVPQVFDFITENDHSFTVMEYIEGDSFDKLLRCNRKFPETQIIKWYCQLAVSLETIHMHNICHRDIKPSNIMLTPSGDVCLIDFNSALVIGNNTGVISRSMGYASPEQYEYFKFCKKRYDITLTPYPQNNETAVSESDCITELITGVKFFKNLNPEGNNKHHYVELSKYTPADAINWKLSDIYSLGATMFHLLTGKRPPVRADDVAKISQLKGYSKEILKTIEKSMKTNPKERFSSANELRNALESY